MIRFVGELEDLKKKLSQLEGLGDWKEINANQFQFRARNGGILNWYPGTGTISFQGKAEAALSLEVMVDGLLNADEAGPPPHDQKAARDEAMQGLSAPDVAEQEAFLDDSYSDSELILGLVGSIGTDLTSVAKIIEDRLKAFNYSSKSIKVSVDVIANMVENPPVCGEEFERISSYMEEGNKLRRDNKDCSILALGVAARINQMRGDTPGRSSFIINSLKSPHEVQRLRKIYSNGFFLIGVHADLERRRSYLMKDLRISEENSARLIARDADEGDDYGQHTRDTYHLSDFFINYDGNHDSLKMQVWRVLDLLLGKPYVTPTFDEYAMFMAFSASLRSADLSRQVGAVLTKNECIVTTGANDVPKAHGGLYWPVLNEKTHTIEDQKDGRDYMRGEDSNAVQKKLIIDGILNSIPLECRAAVSPYLKASKRRLQNPNRNCADRSRQPHAGQCLTIPVAVDLPPGLGVVRKYPFF